MKRFLQTGLRLYKRWISPALPAACRYVPSCSEYACDAIEHHGVLRGCGLAIWRLLRCHPLAKGGYDPVPSTELRVPSPEYRVLTTSQHVHEK